jgi:hypothetical protein
MPRVGSYGSSRFGRCKSAQFRLRRPITLNSSMSNAAVGPQTEFVAIESIAGAAAPIPSISSDPMANRLPGGHGNCVSSDCEPRPSSDGWTIPILSLGIALIACCILIPLGDSNRRMMYEREKLRADLEQIDRQIGVNEEFLQKINEDPTLAERLALRQMKVVRRGAAVLELTSDGKKEDTSPFLLVSVPPPPAMKPYHPVGSHFAEVCRDRKKRLYVLGAGMMLCAAGLVLGASGKG